MGKTRSKAGFSLVEVLVALVILSIGLLALAQLQVAAIRTLSLSRHQTVAIHLAEKQIEYLRAVPMTDNSVPPENDSDQPLLDKDDESILLDDSATGIAAIGDGIASSWHVHRDNPLDELGNHANDGMFYYIRWTINRGSNLASDTFDPLTKRLDVPGPMQMEIVVQVIWYEGFHMQENADGRWVKIKGPADPDVDNISESGLRASGGHYVELRTVRQANL